MECFGSHRIIFGSSPPHDVSMASSLVPPERWFSIAKTVVSELVCGSGELGEAQKEMDDVFFGNASRIWGVEK
jgi:predicted TIM-barrel fold metal-dependent hydrolase